MEILVRIPDGLFRHAKSPERIAQEMRQAAAIFWVARGDVAPEAVSEIMAPAAPHDDGTLYELLMRGPNVGDDADFERSISSPGPAPSSPPRSATR